MKVELIISCRTTRGVIESYALFTQSKINNVSKRPLEENLAFSLVNQAKYLAWNLGLKTRLSDIVSHLRKHNNYPQIVTKFPTMSF